MKKFLLFTTALVAVSTAAQAGNLKKPQDGTKPHYFHESYQDFKNRLDKDYGLTYDGAISILGQRGAPGGHITPWQVQYYGEANWNAFQSEYGNGSFQISYTSNRYIGQKNAEMLGNNLGVASDINDYSTNHNYFTQLSYTHQLPGDMNWMSFTFGQFPMYLFDGNPYSANQQTAFNNLSFSQNASYTYPSASLGGFVTMQPTEDWTAVVGFQDAHNVSGTKIKTSTFDDGKYTSFASVSYTPNIAGLGKGQYSLMVYNQPKVKEQPQESNGWSLNLSQDFGEKWALFSRINGVNKTAEIKQSYVLGTVYKDPFNRDNTLDCIGFAAGVNKVNKDVVGENARDMETVMETYLDFAISDYLIISPDFQYYIKPALKRQNDEAFVYSIRATLLF